MESNGLIPRILLAGAVTLFCIWTAGCSTSRFSGELPAMSSDEASLSRQLAADLTHLASDIGPRDARHHEKLAEAGEWIETSLKSAGPYTVRRQEYRIGDQTFFNVEAELRGERQADQIIVIGAHYDSAHGSPAANDNGTGVVAMLALARRFGNSHPACTLRFVAFVNEEPPYFQTDDMGSLVYARACQQRGEKIVAMLSLETMGCYSDEPGSQKYPFPLSMIYPNRGNFIAFVANASSKSLVNRVTDIFMEHGSINCEKASLPNAIRETGWSDHWSFWQIGVPALMVTDTAPFRDVHYHTAQDTVDKVDFDRLARVVKGLEPVLADLAGM